MAANSDTNAVTYEVFTPEEEVNIVRGRLHDAEAQHYSLTVQQATAPQTVTADQLSAQADVVKALQKMYSDAQTATPAPAAPAASAS